MDKQYDETRKKIIKILEKLRKSINDREKNLLENIDKIILRQNR